MQSRTFCIQVSFIPKGKDTFRKSQAKEVISQSVFSKEFTIGSGRDANIIYKSKGVHPLHVKVRVDGRDLSITDLFSASGVSVNGNKIDPGQVFPLRSGECFQLGESKDLIRIELFQAVSDPSIQANEIIQQAKADARKLRDETDRIFREAKEVDGKTTALIKDAEVRAANLIEEKKSEMERAAAERLQQAIDEGQSQSRQVLRDAEQAAEEMIVDTESKCADLIKKRDVDAERIINEAKEKAAGILGGIEAESQAIVSKAQGQAREIVSAGEVEKQKVLEQKVKIENEIAALGDDRRALEENIATLNATNSKVEESNRVLVEDEKKFAGKYEATEKEFLRKKSELDGQRASLEKDIEEIQERLATHQSELSQTMSKNSQAIKDLQVTEELTKDLKSEIQNKKEKVVDLNRDIEAAIEDKKKAVEEAEIQRKRTSASIIELKKKFEDQYKLRKKAEEERFVGIREREERAGQERRKLLKKHEKERLPYQVDAIAGAIWNDLAVELQDSAFCSDLYESDSKIPKGVKKIVYKSVMEEFDLRTRVSAKVPIYLEAKKAPVAPIKPPVMEPESGPWKNNLLMAVMGAIVTLAVMLSLSLVTTDQPERQISSEKSR